MILKTLSCKAVLFSKNPTIDVAYRFKTVFSIFFDMNQLHSNKF